MHRLRLPLPLAGLLAVLACPQHVPPGQVYLGPPGTSPTHAVVKVNAYDGQPAAWRLRTTARLGDREGTALLPEEVPDQPLAFPATYSVVTDGQAGTLEVQVQALDQAGLTVGRAQGSVELVEQQAVFLELTLLRACSSDVECEDGQWCNGPERCKAGVCQPAMVEQRPCPSSLHACVQQRCLDDVNQCDVRVDHSRCAPVLNLDGTSEGTYCDTLTGCTRGQACAGDADCQDSSLCNGAERCVAGRCLAGIPPSLEDDNDCTLDACVEGQGPAHFPVPDGNRCALSDAGDGICLQGTCAASHCGDGFTDRVLGEQCDHGAANSDTTPDACRADCLPSRCGDGVRDTGEPCDDGNDDADPRCLPGCVLNRCGDGVVEHPRESCDDGNQDDTDSCRNNCTHAGCGDGVVQQGLEECDDGNENDHDACLGTCRRNTCGDGHVLLGAEECDDGNLVDQDGCLASCLLNTCGDGHVLEGVEECDDGNTANGDTCLVTCQRNVCGDGFLLVGLEGCDDGNRDNHDTCLATCQPASCGDRHVWTGVEACDDGNWVSGDGCRGDCRKVESCGDRVLDQGEACDDGNLNPNDGCDACHATTWDATVVTGFGLSQGNPRRQALRNVFGLAVDPWGNLLVADNGGQRIHRWDPSTGLVTPAGGLGGSYPELDYGVLATLTYLGSIVGIAVDLDGSLVVADTSHHVLFRIRRDGVLEDTGLQSPSPRAVVISPRREVIWCDVTNHVVYRNGTVIAGTGTAGYSGDGEPALAAKLNLPSGLALAASGALYVADEGNQVVRRVDPDGIIHTVAGGGTLAPGDVALPARDVALGTPYGLVWDRQGRLWISDANTGRVLVLDQEGQLRSAVGGGPETCGEESNPAAVTLLDPRYLAVDGPGNLYIAESGCYRVLRLGTDGKLSTIMGSPEFVNPFISPDPLPGRSALLTDMDGLAVDAAGNTYVSQFYFNVVFRLGQDGLLGAAAGNTVEDWWRGPAVPVCTLEEGPALRVPLCGPTSMAVGPGNSLHISETRAHAVRRLDGNGNLLVVAGTGTAGDTGDLGPALQARLNEPRGLLFLADGSLLIADALANRVRRVDPDGTIHAWAGTGAAGSGGDLGPATEATLNQPTALARDALSNVYIAERAGNRVRRVAPGGTITTVAGTGTAGNSGDNGPATLAQLNRPLGLWAEGAGTLWIADTRNNVVRHVDWEGTITRVAGNGDAAGPYQDFQPALTLALRRPTAVVRDSGGRLIIAESSQYVLRQLEEGVLSTLAGLAVVGDGTIRQAMPWAPQEMVRMGESAWAWMDGYQWLLRRMDLARDKVEAVAGCVGGFPLGTEPRPAGQAELRPFMDPHASSAVTWAPELSRFFLSVDHRILEVQVPVQEDASTWVMAPFTGVAGPGFQDGGLAVAQFSTLIDGLTWDGPRRRLLVADTRNHCIRVVDVDTHQVSTLAGIPGVDGVTLSPAPMENALLGSVSALVVAGDGSIYAASAKEHRVWHLDAQGTARHVLGTGAPNSGGEGSPAARSGVNNPAQLQVDPYGNLWVASQDSVRVVVAGDDGVATGADPVRTVFGAPPRDRFPATSLDHVSGVALTADGASAMVNDLGLNLVVRLDRRRLP